MFILKAAAKTGSPSALLQRLSEDGSKLIMKKYIHIGVAVDTPNGLVVPWFATSTRRASRAVPRSGQDLQEGP